MVNPTKIKYYVCPHCDEWFKLNDFVNVYTKFKCKNCGKEHENKVDAVRCCKVN